LQALGDLWRDSPDEKLNEKSVIIGKWLKEHPDEEDEAIHDKIWLDHTAGKDIYFYNILEL